MKKNLLFIFIASTLFLGLFNIAFAQTNFTKALSTCEEYSQKGIIVHQNEAYTVQVTLQKGKKDNCVYKEKITIGQNIHLLTCTFNKMQTDNIAKTMNEFSEKYKTHMIKNPIFEAKLSTNAEIFQAYLTNHNYCQISGHTEK